MLQRCPDCVSAAVRALIQRSLVNTRSLHLHSIRQGSITAQWGNDDKTESFCLCVYECKCVCWGIKYAISVLKSLIGPQRQDAVIDCQVTEETLGSAGALRLLICARMWTHTNTHAQSCRGTHTHAHTHTHNNKDLPLQSCRSKPHQFSSHVSHWSLSKGHRWSRQSWQVSWGCQCRIPCSTASWEQHPHEWHCERFTEKTKISQNKSEKRYQIENGDWCVMVRSHIRWITRVWERKGKLEKMVSY